MDANSSSSSTSPVPNSTPSIVELQTWLLDCATELASLERRISRRGLPGSWPALRLRLGIISLLLAEMREGIPLEDWQGQMHVRLIDGALARLSTAIANEPPMPDGPA